MNLFRGWLRSSDAERRRLPDPEAPQFVHDQVVLTALAVPRPVGQARTLRAGVPGDPPPERGNRTRLLAGNQQHAAEVQVVGRVARVCGDRCLAQPHRFSQLTAFLGHAVREVGLRHRGGEELWNALEDDEPVERVPAVDGVDGHRDGVQPSRVDGIGHVVHPVARYCGHIEHLSHRFLRSRNALPAASPGLDSVNPITILSAASPLEESPIPAGNRHRSQLLAAGPLTNPAGPAQQSARPVPLPYWLPRAEAGCMREARQAGVRAARPATPTSRTATEPITAGSSGADAEQLGGDQRLQGEDARAARREADSNERHSLPEDQPEDRRRVAAEGHANADLPGRRPTW